MFTINKRVGTFSYVPTLIQQRLQNIFYLILFYLHKRHNDSAKIAIVRVKLATGVLSFA